MVLEAAAAVDPPTTEAEEAAVAVDSDSDSEITKWGLV